MVPERSAPRFGPRGGDRAGVRALRERDDGDHADRRLGALGVLSEHIHAHAAVWRADAHATHRRPVRRFDLFAGFARWAARTLLPAETHRDTRVCSFPGSLPGDRPALPGHRP